MDPNHQLYGAIPATAWSKSRKSLLDPIYPLASSTQAAKLNLWEKSL